MLPAADRTNGLPARDLVRAYLYMLPGILAMLLVAQRLPLAVQEVAMGVALSGVLAAGATKGFGVREDRTLFRLTVEPYFVHLRDVLVGLGVLGAMGGVAYALLEPAAYVMPLAPRSRWEVLTGVLVFPWLYAFWPAIGLPFYRADMAFGVRTWGRFAAAWRSARRSGAERWLVLAGWYALLLALVMIAALPEGDTVRSALVVLVYVLFLPIPILLGVAVGYRVEHGEQVRLQELPPPPPEASTVGASGAAVSDGREMLLMPEAVSVEGPLPGSGETAAGDDDGDDAPDYEEPGGYQLRDETGGVEEADSGEEPTEEPAEELGREEAPVANSAYRYAVLYALDILPPRHPFQPEGEGRYFVYVEHRNVCTQLFHPRPVDQAMLRDLYAQFERGPGTLYVVEKWCSLDPGRSAPPLDTLPSRVLHAPSERFCVLRDPAMLAAGESAFVTSYRSLRTAIERTAEYSTRHQTAALAGRIVQAFTW